MSEKLNDLIDEKRCDDRKRYVDKELQNHEDRLNGHSKRIDILEQYKSKSEEKIDNLCTSLDKLTSTIKWVMGILIAGWVSFFLYLLEMHIK